MSDQFSFQNSYLFLKRDGGKQALGVLTLLEYFQMSNNLTVLIEEMGYVVRSGQTSFPFIWNFTVMIVKIKVWFCFYVQESNLFLLREGNLKLPALWSAIGLEADVDEGGEGHFLCRWCPWEDQPEGKCQPGNVFLMSDFMVGGKKEKLEAVEIAYDTSGHIGSIIPTEYSRKTLVFLLRCFSPVICIGISIFMCQ